MIAEFSIVPVGKGESLSELVAGAIRIVEESGLAYRAGPMGTVVEGDWDAVMTIIRKCHDSVGRDGARVLTRISIDDRPAQPQGRITEKLASVERRLGHEINK